MTAATIRERITSVCATPPFGFTPATTPFSFDLQPTGAIDEVFRLEIEGGDPIGGFNFTEERTDLVHLWVARKYAGDPDAVYQRLLVDVSSLRAAVVRDGVQVSGEYSVPDDGAAVSILREPGREFAILRMTVPVVYDTTL